MTHDVAIIGAGPAGAIAARDLARAGARVALIDGSHPREKPCGGGVTGRALARAGCALTGGQTIERVIFEAAGARASVALDDPGSLRVFSRAAFDAALVDAARDAGADIVPRRATSFARTDSSWRILTSAGAIDARWLLGADGAGGITRKQLFRPFERRQISIAAGSYVDDVEMRDIVIAFVDRPRGYLWSFPRDGHLAVGTCAQADETTTAQMHAVTDRWLDRYAPAHGRARRRYAWPIPSLSPRDIDAERPTGEGWMLLGDAAGLVDPITREGIFFAVRSGELAGAAMGTADPARTYADALRDDLYAELRRAARLKAGFYRPPFTRLVVEALQHSAAIRAVMVDLVAGAQPYAGLKRRLLGTREFGLMFRLLSCRATKLVEKAS
jgi:geranylgeranyl reductase family protein